MKSMSRSVFVLALWLFAVALALPYTLAAADGHLKVSSNPASAGVFLDGNYIGPAERFHCTVKYDVPAGEHEVRLADPRYESKTFKVTVTAGKTTKVKEQLTKGPEPKPPYGRLKVNQDATLAAVFLNDKYYGHVDEFNGDGQGLLIAPGDYEIKIVPAGGGSAYTEKIKIEEGKTTTVRPH